MIEVDVLGELLHTLNACGITSKYACAGLDKGDFRDPLCYVSTAVGRQAYYTTDLKWNHMAFCRRRWLRPKALTG